MSIRTLTTLAEVRRQGVPKKTDIGRATSGTATATVPDILAALVPTALVAPYTATVATIVAGMTERTPTNPSPNAYLPWRWGVFAILVVAAAGWVWSSGQSRANRFPALEILGVTVAATGWGLVVPESPLIGALHGDNKRLVPIVVGFAAVAASAIIANFLKKQAAGQG